MSPDELAILRLGTRIPEPASVRLAAGALTADLVGGALRAVRWHGIEVLRAVAYVVRDRDWGTLAPEIGDLDLRQDAAGFAVGYRARCRSAEGAVLDLSARIAGRPDGTLTMTVEALPDRDFETNRCGFCVLHPVVGLAGRPVMVEHADGTVTTGSWPDAIAPWQPFCAIRAITHAVVPGLSATCRMEGDVFEMEDQRNWSDASYKTYVRPLALPWPYRLPAGEPFRQSVGLSLSGDLGAAASPAPEGEVALSLGDEPVGLLPRVGLLVTPEEAGAVLASASRLTEVGPQLLLLHVDPTIGHGTDALRRLAAVRRLLPDAEAVLECVVPGRDDPAHELARVAAAVRAADLRLDAVAVSPAVDRQSTPPGSPWPDCPPLDAVYAAARAAFPELRLGGGMFSYFTELNRKRPPVAALDFVTHCTCPIVHAADDLSVMQTLEALPFIVRSARGIIGEKPYRIGPATIGMRQNPYGARTYDNPDGGRLTMTHADPRQRGLFAAAWMTGYAAATAEAGLDALTVGALTGAFGLLDGTAVRPAFHAARTLARLAGARRLACRSSRPDRVLALAAERDGRRSVVLANLTGEERRVAVPAGFRTVATLDEATMPAAAAGDPPPTSPCPSTLVLRPYAVARLET